MRCAFCDHVFDPDAARASCRNCALFGGCEKVKCPRCGYESPAETRLVRWLREKVSKRK